MNNAIQSIYTNVRLLLSHSPNQEGSNLLENLSVESNGFRVILYRAYQKNSQSQKLKEEFNRCLGQLCAIAYELWLAKPANTAVKNAQRIDPPPKS
ncbi:hypothetical protein [Pedobacter sp.]